MSLYTVWVNGTITPFEIDAWDAIDAAMKVAKSCKHGDVIDVALPESPGHSIRRRVVTTISGNGLSVLA